VQILLTANNGQEMLTIETGVIALECIRNFFSSTQHSPGHAIIREDFGVVVLNAECFREENVILASHASLP
jgi:hypothetical protein